MSLAECPGDQAGAAIVDSHPIFRRRKSRIGVGTQAFQADFGTSSMLNHQALQKRASARASEARLRMRPRRRCLGDRLPDVRETSPATPSSRTFHALLVRGQIDRANQWHFEFRTGLHRTGQSSSVLCRSLKSPGDKKGVQSGKAAVARIVRVSMQVSGSGPIAEKCARSRPSAASSFAATATIEPESHSPEQHRSTGRSAQATTDRSVKRPGTPRNMPRRYRVLTRDGLQLP